jgi:hypothetical protein
MSIGALMGKGALLYPTYAATERKIIRPAQSSHLIGDIIIRGKDRVVQGNPGFITS